jgi:hypothetical protein
MASLADCTVPCRFFALGNCNRGQKCKFLHTNSDGILYQPQAKRRVVQASQPAGSKGESGGSLVLANFFRHHVARDTSLQVGGTSVSSLGFLRPPPPLPPLRFLRFHAWLRPSLPAVIAPSDFDSDFYFTFLSSFA